MYTGTEGSTPLLVQIIYLNAASLLGLPLHPMSHADPAGHSFVDVDQFGEGFAAGCRLLRTRYHLSDEAVFLIGTMVAATAIGPTARIRNPLGGDLPLSLDITFCADAQSPVFAAVSDGLRFFREIVGQKVVWRENVGSRRLRAEFLDTLNALEAVELLLRQAAPEVTLPASMPSASPDQDEVIRRTQLERENRLAHRDLLRAELAERRMDLAPFLVGEDPGWDTVLALDKLAFDHCFTSISPEGAMLRELLAAPPKQLGKITRLLQASHHGRNLTDGAAVMLSPVLISLHVATPELLAAALKNRGIREGGVLHGVILEIPNSAAAYDAAAFVNDTDEEIRVEFLARLFAQRGRGMPRLYMLNHGGFNLLEDFRRWCTRATSEHPGLGDFTVEWPGFVLKLALCLHLAAGKEEQETLDPVTVGVMAELMKSIGDQQLQLLGRLIVEPTAANANADQVADMVVKLDQLGGTATMRRLFRRYSGQEYTVLTPVLDRAVSDGRILRDGKRLWLPTMAVRNAAAEMSTSTCQR